MKALSRQDWESKFDTELDAAFLNTTKSEYENREAFLSEKYQEYVDSVDEQNILNKGY